MLPIPTSASEVNGYFDWLRNTIAGTDYGEIGIRFIVHQGMITRVCKTVEVPEKQGIPVKFTLQIGNGDSA